MINAFGVEYLSMTDAGLLTEPVTSSATVYRWVRTGVGGVKLKIKRIGGRLYTTEDYVKEFLSETGRET